MNHHPARIRKVEKDFARELVNEIMLMTALKLMVKK